MKKFGLYKIFLAVLILAAAYAGYFYFVGRFAAVNKEFDKMHNNTSVKTTPLVSIPAEPIKKNFTIHDVPPRPANPLRDKDGNIYSDSGNSLDNPVMKPMDPNAPYNNN